MNTAVNYPVAGAAAFLWIGFVCAISFMEAWLKFRAPGVTLPLGLSIGRLVFSGLNKVEWVLAVAILTILLLSGSTFSGSLFMLIPVILLLLQTFWLLPSLDKRAEMYIQGQSAATSSLHIYYLIAEVVKVLSLLIFGSKLLKFHGL